MVNFSPNTPNAASYGNIQPAPPAENKPVTGMQAQMPAPSNIQNSDAQNKMQDNKQGDKQGNGLNIGVLEGPKVYSKTPVTDSLERQKNITPRTKLPAMPSQKFTYPKPGGAQGRLSAGEISSYLAAGSFFTMGAMFLCKVVKSFRHK